MPSQRSEDSDVLPEVETDLESAVDDPGVDISSGSDTDAAAAAVAPDDAAAAMAPDGAGAALAPQLRAGRDTWTVFRNLWWRITSSALYKDVRINIASEMANAGMGADGLQVQKQFKPERFGETKPNVPVTVLVLRCWSIWRAQQGSWIDDVRHPYRRRELRHQQKLLRDDVASFHAAAALAPDAPFCNNADAHRLARHWVPDIVTAVTGRSA